MVVGEEVVGVVVVGLMTVVVGVVVVGLVTVVVGDLVVVVGLMPVGGAPLTGRRAVSLGEVGGERRVFCFLAALSRFLA